MGAAFFSYFSGQGKTWYSAVINSGACVLNVILAYIMIFGKFGCPAMGIMGAGIATTVSLFVNFVTIFLVFLFQDQSKHPTRKYCRIDIAEIKRLFAFGTPSGLQVFLEVGAFTLFCFLVGDLGIEALASTTIVLAINNLSFLPLLGLMDATAIICGQYIGKNDLKTAEKVAFRAWFVAVFYMIFACSVYVFLPSWLMGNFAPKHMGGEVNFQEVFELGRQILICAAIFNFFDATKFIFMGALRGAGDTLSILIMGTCLSWLFFVPGVIILIKVFHTPVIYVWIFMTGYILVESAIYFWRFKSEKWKKINMINRKQPQSMEAEPINENIPPL
jgi:MATE family multidrug resistance protein